MAQDPTVPSAEQIQNKNEPNMVSGPVEKEKDTVNYKVFFNLPFLVIHS